MKKLDLNASGEELVDQLESNETESKKVYNSSEELAQDLIQQELTPQQAHNKYLADKGVNVPLFESKLREYNYLEDFLTHASKDVGAIGLDASDIIAYFKLNDIPYVKKKAGTFYTAKRKDEIKK